MRGHVLGAGVTMIKKTSTVFDIRGEMSKEQMNKYLNKGLKNNIRALFILEKK